MFYRYRLWIMVWKAWTRYIHSCDEKKKKDFVCKLFLSRLLLKRAWVGWRKYSKWRREKKVKRSLSGQCHMDALKRRYWFQWRQEMTLRLQGQAMDLVGLHHWATCLQGKVGLHSCCHHVIIACNWVLLFGVGHYYGQVWSQWTTCYDERVVSLGKLATASYHSARKLKQVVLKAWLEYVKVRRKKLYLRRVALGYHSSALVLKCFSSWKTQCRHIAQFEELIVHKNRLSLCRRVMIQWRFCIFIIHYTNNRIRLVTHPLTRV